MPHHGRGANALAMSMGFFITVPKSRPAQKLCSAPCTITARMLLTHTAGFGYDFLDETGMVRSA